MARRPTYQTGKHRAAAARIAARLKVLKGLLSIEEMDFGEPITHRARERGGNVAIKIKHISCPIALTDRDDGMFFEVPKWNKVVRHCRLHRIPFWFVVQDSDSRLWLYDGLACGFEHDGIKPNKGRDDRGDPKDRTNCVTLLSNRFEELTNAPQQSRATLFD